jgi:ATP-dependent RNA helicase DbpA
MQATGTVFVILSNDEPRPDYLPTSLDEYHLPDQSSSLPKAPEFVTLYISGGRKNKLSKIDIVGFFGQKGGLEKGDLGRIDVLDFQSFAAVRHHKITDLLTRVRDEKMKGKKYKIEVAR